MKFHTFFGVRFLKATYIECLDIISSRLKNKEQTLIVTPNPEILYDAYNDKKLAAILRSSDIAIPDGVGIFVGYQIADSKLPRWIKYGLLPLWCIRAVLHRSALSQEYGERITGSRLTLDILTLAAKNHIGVTIIDPLVTGNSASDILKRASQKNMQDIIEKKYPGIQCSVIVTDEDKNISAAINHPIVIATHGAGKQEKILHTLFTQNTSIILGIGAGSSIDLITGFRMPVPGFFSRWGGEWLYRLYKNPKKHSKRIWRVLKFLYLCIQTNNN